MKTKCCPHCKGTGKVETESPKRPFKEGDIVFACWKTSNSSIDGRAIVVGYEECDDDCVRVRDRKGHDYIVPIRVCELDSRS